MFEQESKVPELTIKELLEIPASDKLENTEQIRQALAAYVTTGLVWSRLQKLNTRCATGKDDAPGKGLVNIIVTTAITLAIGDVNPIAALLLAPDVRKLMPVFTPAVEMGLMLGVAYGLSFNAELTETDRRALMDASPHADATEDEWSDLEKKAWAHLVERYATPEPEA